MTLTDALASLAGNLNLNVSLVDSDDTEMIRFNAAGYQNIESDLFSRTVDSITINSSSIVTIKLASAV
jgi:hypothetical protein